MSIYKINSKELAAYLEKWFELNNPTDERFWSYDPAAKIIKKNLKKINRWRNQPRGNPRKGYLKMQEGKSSEGF